MATTTGTTIIDSDKKRKEEDIKAEQLKLFQKRMIFLLRHINVLKPSLKMVQKK